MSPHKKSGSPSTRRAGGTLSSSQLAVTPRGSAAIASTRVRSEVGRNDARANARNKRVALPDGSSPRSRAPTFTAPDCPSPSATNYKSCSPAFRFNRVARTEVLSASARRRRAVPRSAASAVVLGWRGRWASLGRRRSRATPRVDRQDRGRQDSARIQFHHVVAPGRRGAVLRSRRRAASCNVAGSVRLRRYRAPAPAAGDELDDERARASPSGNKGSTSRRAPSAGRAAHLHRCERWCRGGARRCARQWATRRGGRRRWPGPPRWWPHAPRSGREEDSPARGSREAKEHWPSVSGAVVSRRRVARADALMTTHG